MGAGSSTKQRSPQPADGVMPDLASQEDDELACFGCDLADPANGISRQTTEDTQAATPKLSADIDETALLQQDRRGSHGENEKHRDSRGEIKAEIDETTLLQLGRRASRSENQKRRGSRSENKADMDENALLQLARRGSLSENEKRRAFLSDSLQEAGKRIVDDGNFSRQISVETKSSSSSRLKESSSFSRQISPESLSSTSFSRQVSEETQSSGSRMCSSDPELRAQRRALIRAHRAGMEGADPGSPTSPTSPVSPGVRSTHSESSNDHHGHQYRPRRSSGSHLSMESMAILQKRSEEAAQLQKPEEDIYGFKAKDRVTAAGGPDEHGPWEKLGEGVILEKAWKRGFVHVRFDQTGEVFPIKAANLRNLTDHSRSGQNNLPTQAVLKRRRSLTKVTQQELLDLQSQSDPLRGLRPGDHVNIGNGGEGILVKAGKEEGTCYVNFGDLGIRLVPVSQLNKKRCDGVEDRQLEAQKARETNGNNGRRQSFTLSLEEASGVFTEQLAMQQLRAKTDEGRRLNVEETDGVTLQREREAAQEPENPNRGLQVGDYVKVNDDDENPMWHELGIGMIRSLGPKLGSFMVQFESGGDSFVLFASMLEKVQAPSQTRFRQQGQKAKPESELGKQRYFELLKEGSIS